VSSPIAVKGRFLDADADIHTSLIAFTDKEPKDFMVPSRWGTVSLQCVQSSNLDNH
jgi:hypothetical protein